LGSIIEDTPKISEVQIRLKGSNGGGISDPDVAKKRYSKSPKRKTSR